MEVVQTEVNEYEKRRQLGSATQYNHPHILEAFETLCIIPQWFYTRQQANWSVTHNTYHIWYYAILALKKTLLT